MSKMSDSVAINLAQINECDNSNSGERERESIESLSSCFSEMENVDFEEVYTRLRLDIHETLDEIVEEKMQALHKRIRELEQDNQVLLDCKTSNEQTILSLCASNSELKYEVLTLQDTMNKDRSKNNHEQTKTKKTIRFNGESKNTICKKESNPSVDDSCLKTNITQTEENPNTTFERMKLAKQHRPKSFSGFSAEIASTVNKQHTILGRTGTIRGYQNTVKKKVNSYKLISNYSLLSVQVQKIVESEIEDEDASFPGKLVVYTTSSIKMREMFEHSRLTMGILMKHKIEFEERDLFINPGYASELNERVQDEQTNLPLVFLRGCLLGNWERIVELEDEGNLSGLLEEFKRDSIKKCLQCRGKRFTLCLWCQGTKKGLLSLKCSVCNRNGLQPCFECNRVNNLL